MDEWKCDYQTWNMITFQAFDALIWQ